MKKQVLVVSALFISMTLFAQKNELKEAEKAIKANNYTAAIASINQAEKMLSGADDKTVAKFYYLKAQALYQNGSANADIEKAGEAFNQLLNFEKEKNVNKYSTEVAGLLNDLIKKVADAGSKDYNLAVQSKDTLDYLKAAKDFYQVYALSPKDTAYLDNAALVYNFAKDYKTSIKLYQKLLDLHYTGPTKEFVATNKSTGEDQTFANQKEMDLQVKLGLAENPRVEKKDSRRELVFKYLAENYSDIKDYNKALEVLNNGLAEFPKSYSLLIDQANVYYNLGNNDKFKELLVKAIDMNPTEPTLYYNVGVMNMQQKNTDEAIKYFKKAVELDPNYADAYNNIGAAIIDKAAPIIDEMNKSLTDFDKYDQLQKKQFDVYREAVPYYEKAYQLNPKNISTVQTLMGLYENLDMKDKLEAIKPVYQKLKAE